ncbi:hypothetical protein TpMuguga_03g00207 [Theileria parva strain Muguga]|uniref:Uncharacterized protein n=1 Tax=Theileria parva TaxID=5875 RepID=Q4N0D7_THEPA|nr:uncharacterized protein TpMuguga_03g00207 [Theileria parva strain Muguga]EAN30942.1 hypothetical protein TpMuguga_03g00207 [Theileria parva strain Muguga]|eukprot:XP_763225.1 hypothetical protein [Theileria parva strain Muguga]
MMEFGKITNSQLQPNFLLTSSDNFIALIDSHDTSVQSSNTVNNISNALYTNTLNPPNNNTLDKINNLNRITRYRSKLKSTIVYMECHPRLPNIVAIGCADGSVYLFFYEIENFELFDYFFVHKFELPVKKLIWYLFPFPLDEELKFIKKNFVQRIWKSVYSSKYTSILLVQLQTPSNSSHDVVYYMRLMNKINVFPLNLVKNVFDLLIIQFPPPIETNQNSDTTSTPRECYDNYSVICDYLCVTHRGLNSVKFELFLLGLDLKFQLIKSFNIKVHGSITNIILTNKQYNQYSLYNFGLYRYDSNNTTDGTNNGDGIDSSVNGDNTEIANGVNSSNSTMVSGKCVNTLQQFLILSTNLGHVYITSLVDLYNKLTPPRLDSLVLEEKAQFDEIFICNSNILDLNFTVVYSPDFFTSELKPFKTNSNCLCNDGCYYVVSIGLHDTILLYVILCDHKINKLSLKLIHLEKVKYNSVLFINEPFNYFKLLINQKNCLLQLYFNYEQIHSLLNSN